MASLAAILAILTVLTAAPLILGSYVIAQGASRTLLLLWFGFLTMLLIAALGSAAVGLLLSLL